MAQTPEMKKKTDQAAANLFGRTRTEAFEQEICVKCGTSVAAPYAFLDAASAREYLITGFCQQCQDTFYGSLEE